MSLAAVSVLGLEVVFVAVAALALFRLRNYIGLGPLYIFIGTNQYLSVLLASSIYVGIAPDLFVSPGSAVLFSSSMFVILLVYLGTDIPTSRGLIVGVLVANVTLTALLWFTGWQMKYLDIANPLGLPAELFLVSPRVFIVGTLVLLVDFLLVVVLFQWLTVRWRAMPLLLRIVLTLVVTLSIDALMFSSLVFFGQTTYTDVLRGQLAGKFPAAVAFGILLFAYLRLFEPQLEARRRNVAGQIDDVFSIFTYRERYRKVRQQLAAARAASLAKSRFLANVSHELRTPLNAIIGFTSVMLQSRSRVDDEHRVLLGRVWSNGMHLLELINGLLDLSKIESGRNELDLVPVDLNELVVETVEQLRADADQKGLEVRIDVGAESNIVLTDRMRLKQVLINLVGNAVKFTDTGTVSTRVSGAAAERTLRVDIVDTGAGIQPGKLERVFDPFYHEDHANSSEPGVGLGLAIARALCEQMGHRLEVSSEPGSGSTFSIRFFVLTDEAPNSVAA